MASLRPSVVRKCPERTTGEGVGLVQKSPVNVKKYTQGLLTGSKRKLETAHVQFRK